jgi:hypothetical protein
MLALDRDPAGVLTQWADVELAAGVLEPQFPS